MMELLKQYHEGDWNYWKGVSEDSHKIFSPFEYSGHGSWNGYPYDRVLVFEAQWLDVEVVKQKSTYDKSGNLHVHEYMGNNKAAKLRGKEKTTPGNSLEEKNIQIVRKACLIAGETLVNWGKKENTVRDWDNPETTKLDYVTVVNLNNNQDSVSMMDRISGLNDQKNYVLTLLQKEITKHVGSIIAVDSSKIDTNIYGVGKKAIGNLLLNAKAHGIVVYNGKKDATYASLQQKSVPFDQLEPRFGGFVNDCIAIAAYLEQQINMIVGINESRMGTAGERKLVSSMQMEISSSSLMTKPYLSAFYGWEERLLEKHSEQIAMCWAHEPEKYETIAIQLGIEIPDDFDIDLQSYKVDVVRDVISVEKFMQVLEASVAQGNLVMPDYMKLLQLIGKDGLNVAIERYYEMVQRREQEMQMQQQQQQQHEKQMQQAATQAQMQNEADKIDRKGKWDLQKAESMNQASKRANKLALNQKERALDLDRFRAVNDVRSSRLEQQDGKS